MKAIIHHGYGDPHDVLQFDDVDPPEVGAREVLVRMRAASVNPADWHIVRGEPRIARLQLGLGGPRRGFLRGGVPGCDVAGTVEAVGPEVTAFRPGHEVFGSTFVHGFGAFAELVVVPEDLLVERPAGLSHVEAAAVPLAALTALQALRDHARVEPGQRVLIVGASGGVGAFAVQIARDLGAEVTGVCSARNVDMVRSLGANHVIDYATEDFTLNGQTYDVVLQLGGSRPARECRRALEPTGILLQVGGESDGRWVGPVGRIVGGALLSPFVGQTIKNFTVVAGGDDLRHLARLIERGVLTPIVERTYPLADVAAAIGHVEEGHTRGKVVVTA